MVADFLEVRTNRLDIRFHKEDQDIYSIFVFVYVFIDVQFHKYTI